jgi:ABC-type branched-subunit amino acid transport system ATPase component/branched-subunit amino acid ABC-type transport system permease component
MASGLVLTYTTSGIFNFAHGAVAFTTAYLYYQLNTGLSVPIVPSVVISVFIFAPLLGLLLDRLLLGRLAKAPPYARIVGTVGLLVALPALMQWLVVAVGNDSLGAGLPGNEAQVNGLPVPGVGPTPSEDIYLFSGVTLNTDQIAVFIVAAIAAIVLWLVIRRSRIGLEMRAVVDRESLAGLRGVNPARTSRVAWVLTMMLAGFGGVLIAPLFELSDFVFTLVVLGSLAAVVLGGLRSLPIAFIGGLLLGIIQNLVAGYADDILPAFIADLTGLRSAVPYILVLILGIVVGRDRGRRRAGATEDPPRPDHREGLPKWRRRLPWAVFTVLLIGFSLQWIDVGWLQADTYDQTVIAQSLATAIIFLSFVVVTGLGGMVSLAQTSFATAGGFAAGWALGRDWGIDIPLIASDGQINFVWAAVIGTLCAAALGALIAIPAVRLGAVFLALWSLAMAIFLSLVVFAYEPIGHGQLGWFIRAPSLDLPVVSWVRDLIQPGDQSFLDFSQVPDQILLFLALFGAITLVIHALQRSATGRAILAVRSSEVAAQSSGVRANHTKVMVFALSAGIAGFGGVLLSLYGFAASNNTAPPLVGLFWLALAALFGIRRPGGALIAGLAFGASAAVFHWLATDILPGGTVNTLVSSIYFVPILAGLGAIQLAQEPDGILALAGNQKLEKRRAKAKKAEAEAKAAAAPPAIPTSTVETAVKTAATAVPDAALTMHGIVAGYGDVEVLHGVSIFLQPGTITALLGANGAGKSTLCSVAGGDVEPTAGSVHLGDVDITAAPPFERARGGLLLVPEVRGIFPGLTVEENVALMLRSEELRSIAYEQFPILGERRKQSAGLLSGGEQQMLSLAPALAEPPSVLIADEPTLGLAPLAAEEVMRTIVELRDRGAAVLLVEEHARHALEIADYLAFIELGTVLWEGPRSEADTELLTSAYLGGHVHAAGYDGTSITTLTAPAARSRATRNASGASSNGKR